MYITIYHVLKLGVQDGLRHLKYQFRLIKQAYRRKRPHITKIDEEINDALI